MAIQWGAWEYSGGNGMRVGLDISWEAISHTETEATATVEIWTQNQYSYSDSQTLTYGGDISGSTSFTNDDGGTAQLRATKTYSYTYGANSYGSSPSTRTFSASLSGAFNGVTPSVSKTSMVPSRPYAAPAPPTSASASRLSDSQIQVSWVNHATAGEPWTNVHMIYTTNNGATWPYVTTGIAGSASSYTVGTWANAKWSFQVAAVNSVGSSTWNQTGVVYTSPGTPTSCTRTPSGADQVISWTNNVGYSEYTTEVYASQNNGAYALLASKATGVTSHTHVAPSSAIKWKYIVIARAVSGLYGAWSNETTQTAGTTTPPLASTGLSPNGTVVDPTTTQALTWTFVPGQGGDTQTKYQLRHRLSGSGTWTTTSVITSTTSSYTLAANTYTSGQVVEWQVATYGADPAQGPWSTSATYQNTSASAKRPLTVDVYTGEVEAPSAAFLIPTGGVVMWPAAVAPVGWLLCQGQTVLRSTYPALFAAIGTTWNWGGEDGTNFRLPFFIDGYGPIGAGIGVTLGGYGGSTAISAANLPPHSHTGVDHLHATGNLQKTGTVGSGTDNGGGSVAQGATSGRFVAAMTGSTTTGAADRSLTTGNGPGTSAAFRPPYAGINFIIRT